MRSITFHTCQCGTHIMNTQSDSLCECQNTGKNVLLVELSYKDYNYFVNKLKYDQHLMKSYEYYQSKYQINFVYLEDNDDACDMDDTLIESFINLNL